MWLLTITTLVRWALVSGRGAPTVVSEGLSLLSLLRVDICEPTETPLTYQGFDLVLEIDTVVRVMAVVLVETAIFGLVFPAGRVS